MTMLNSRHKGYAKGFGVAALALVAAIVGHSVGTVAELSPLLLQGAGGGAVLGAFVYAQYRKLRTVSPLVDATSEDRLTFEEPRTAKVTHPPHGTENYEVFAVETNPGGDFPFKVWVKDGSGKEHHPFYASAVEFTDH